MECCWQVNCFLPCLSDSVVHFDLMVYEHNLNHCSCLHWNLFHPALCYYYKMAWYSFLDYCNWEYMFCLHCYIRVSDLQRFSPQKYLYVSFEQTPDLVLFFFLLWSGTAVILNRILCFFSDQMMLPEYL